MSTSKTGPSHFWHSWYTHELLERTGKQLKKVHHFQNAAELKELIQAAQKGDKTAIETLCKAFEPLIMKEAHRSYILQALGEDAVNTAWEIFLNFVQKYDKPSYLKLPGLVKTTLRYELFHRAFRGISVSDCTCLDANEHHGNIAVSDEHLFVEKIENKSLVNYLLSRLTEKQRKVIEAIFMHNLTLDEYRQQEGISFKVAFLHQQAALKKMHKALEYL